MNRFFYALVIVGLAVGLAPSVLGAESSSRKQNVTFYDTPGTTHEKNIECLVSLGITRGYGNGHFGPGDPVTRGQMATFIARTLDAAAEGKVC